MLGKRTFIFIILFLILMKASFSVAADESLKGLGLEGREARWEIKARKLSYLEREGLYVAEGDVVISRDGQVLSAQKASYNEKTGVAEVSGDVRLEINGDILTGESGAFNLKTYTGQITKGRLFDREHHFYISGDLVEKVGPNRYMIKNCRLTTCDGVKPDWSVTGSEVEVTVEGYGKVKNVAFRIRDVPFFYLPYAIFPVKTKRQSGVLPPQAGYSNINGAMVEVPIFWAISDQTDATFYPRYMSKRGFMQGFEFRYVAEHDSKGDFLFDILFDDMKEKNLNDPDDVELSPFPRTNETRYWLRSRTDQQLPLGVLARLDTDFVSDQDYLREFTGGLVGYEARQELAGRYGRPIEEIQSPNRRSALRLSRDGQGYSLQGGGAYFQLPENPPNDPTPQPLGIANFSILPTQIPSLPLFLKRFDTVYEYIWRDVGTQGQSISFSPAVNYPIWFGRYLAFEPSVGYAINSQWFDEPGGDTNHQSKDVYEVQGRLSTILERIFDFQWRDAKKLKHQIRPSLIYTYRVPQDEDKPSPWFEPILTEGRINRFSFALENFFDVRKENEKGEVSYAQWAALRLAQGYDVDEARRDEEPAREKRPFEPLEVELRLTPFPYLDFKGGVLWDHQEDQVSATDLSLEFSLDRSGGRKDRFKVDYLYIKGESENINYNINVNLWHGFSVGTFLQKDISRRHDISTGYWLEYQSHCWGVRLSATSFDEISTFMVTFNLLGLGGI
jgi:LPS-assembly protein